MKKIIILIIFFVIVLIFPAAIFSKVGVGIGTGKIRMSDLKAGGIYEVSPLSIVNTGDEVSDYQMGVAYNTNQPEMWPEKSWFKFTPGKFTLQPGAGQIVQVKLNLPVKMKPGDYFAYLEAKPVPKPTLASGGNVARVGVAAASKFYFSVIPSNIWQAIIYRFSTLLKNYAPWSYIISIVIISACVFAAITILFKKYFHFQINISKK